MSLQQLTQIPSLSEPCNKIIFKYDDLFTQKIGEEEFWTSIQDFRRILRNYPKEVMAQLKIQVIIKNIEEFFDTIFRLRNEREEATTSGYYEDVRKLSDTIMKNYRKLITEVTKLQEKTQLVEHQTTSDINITWVSSFFIRYYDIITTAGGLDDIIVKMEVQLDAMNEKLIKGCFTRQKRKLEAIETGVKYLNKVNLGFPSDLRQEVLNIYDSIGKLLKLFDEKNLDLNEKAGKILDSHRKFKQELQNLYKETIGRVVVG